MLRRLQNLQSCGASINGRAWSGSQDTYVELHPLGGGRGGNVAQARAESDRRTTFAARRKERRISHAQYAPPPPWQPEHPLRQPKIKARMLRPCLNRLSGRF